MNNQQLNELVKRFKSERSDEVFEQLYAMVSKNWRSLGTVARSVMSNEAEILAAYEDELLKCIEVYDGRGDFINLLNRYIWRKRNDIYKVAKGRKKFTAVISEFENEDGSEAANFEIADEFNLEDYILKKKKADQRQLIDSLLNGADAKTTAIVEAFLASENSSPTAIGEALGLHHSTVIRTLKRLAGKFDSRKFGSHQDYLVAL
jgi:DNA-directed RNA polymerase specialized sigma24 family protein